MVWSPPVLLIFQLIPFLALLLPPPPFFLGGFGGPTLHWRRSGAVGTVWCCFGVVFNFANRWGKDDQFFVENLFIFECDDAEQVRFTHLLCCFDKELFQNIFFVI